MIGYFFAGSKFVGLNIIPYRSVLPSRALTVNGSGGTQPAASRREMSAVAIVATVAPSSARRSNVTGGCRSEEHTSELQSLMRISYAVFCLKKKTRIQDTR